VKGNGQISGKVDCAHAQEM